MRVITYLDNFVSNELLRKQQQSTRKQELENSLSGSILGKPLQDQILHIAGVPTRPLEAYVLKKFQRGHDVEAWVMSLMPGLLPIDQILEYAKKKDAIMGISDDGQPKLLYKNAKGHIDGLVDMAQWDDPELKELGIIPHEVKSVTNAKFKMLSATGRADTGHKYQAGMYAMALRCDHFIIHYIASDDYRITSLLYETEDVAPFVDQIIDQVEAQLRRGRVPAFEPRETWQANKMYQSYPAWSELTEEEANEKLKTEYPDAYKRLLSFAV